MEGTRWNIAKRITPEEQAVLGDLDPLLAQLLYNRGARTRHDVESFLDPGRVEGNPFELADMPAAVARVRQAIRGGERIAIYGDYDADGVCSTALLTETLHALGAVVTHYIPDRVAEGYGLNKSALAQLARDGCKLVVTVDCGTRSVEEAAFARRCGLDLVITDHHGLGEELPSACAVVNPCRRDGRYPYDNLAGVGVAYKLAQALLRVERNLPALRRVEALLQEEELLDLVALGTVADVVPLLGENRALVWRGLQRLNATTRPGLQAMFREAGLNAGEIESWTIGYVLGPRINAAGRLDTAQASLDLLLAKSGAEAEPLAKSLGEQNRARQELTQQLLDEARADALQQGIGEIILVAGERYMAGVAGLVAGQLTREFYRPAVVVELGDGLSKASARSIREFHITAALDQCADLLVRHGGHAEAAGLTVRTENWPALADRLRAIAAEQLGKEPLRPTLEIDAELPLTDVNEATIALVDVLQPFGHDNHPPLFASRGVEIADRRVVRERHLQLWFRRGHEVVPAIAFGRAEWGSTLPRVVDVAYRIKLNEWHGRRTAQMQVEDVRPAKGA